MSLRDSFKSSKSFRSSKGVTILAKWCNGSTTDSGSVCLGSNPSLATKKKDSHLRVFLFFLLAKAAAAPRVVCATRRLCRLRRNKIRYVQVTAVLPPLPTRSVCYLAHRATLLFCPSLTANALVHRTAHHLFASTACHR